MRDLPSVIGEATSLFFRLAVLLPLSACSSATDEPSSSGPTVAQPFQQTLRDRGTRETLLEGVVSAENQTFSADGRLFVTGDSGIYEIKRDPSGTILSDLLQPGDPYVFGGITEIDGVLYVNAYTAALESSLFAARLTESPAFELIYTFQGGGLPNGSATDGSHLFVANTIAGTILRLAFDPADPFVVTTVETWFSRETGALAPNGIEVVGSLLYFTDGLTVRSIAIQPDGSPGAPSTLVAELTLFDDLSVDSRGIIVANFLLGSLEAFDPLGKRLADTWRNTFVAPSSVVPANGRLGFGPDDLLVTEKGAGRLSVYHPSL